MKQFAALLMVFVLLFNLTACGQSHADDGTQAENTTAFGENAIPAASGSEEPVENEKTEEVTETNSKILVAYFSATGTTRSLAEYAADILNADLYEIVPEEAYTDEDLAYYTNGRADREQNDPNARPVISRSVEDMADYDIVFIGYPIWLAYHNLIQCTQA